MKARKSKTTRPAGVSPAAQELPFLFVPVTEDVRQLASDLEKAFARIYPVDMASQRRAAAVFLKMPDESSANAKAALAELGIWKNRLLPSIFEDYYHRHQTRIKVTSGLHGLGSTILAASNKDWSIEMPSRDDAAGQDAFRLNFGQDPLENPITVLRPDFPNAELMIFLEQYLPSDLEEVAGDLAHAREYFCRLPLKLLSLLEIFRLGFDAISAIRSDFVLRERELYPVIDRAHAELRRLAVIIAETGSEFHPHLIEISGENDDLVFSIDGEVPFLTKSKKDTLAALAILEDDPEFTTKKFAKLLGAPTAKPQATDQGFINRRNALRDLLPRLEYDPKHGVRRPRGFVFSKRPSVERLKNFLTGNLKDE
jgi:hypothetical protein